MRFDSSAGGQWPATQREVVVLPGFGPAGLRIRLRYPMRNITVTIEMPSRDGVQFDPFVRTKIDMELVEMNEPQDRVDYVLGDLRLFVEYVLDTYFSGEQPGAE